jgi:hypothetical protein
VLSLGLPPLHIAPFFLYSSTALPNEIDDTAQQEQYYEIPHWMHLSFVSYESDESVFVDHLFEAEEAKPSSKIPDNQPELEILANGFLLPRKANVTTNIPTSSSVQREGPFASTKGDVAVHSEQPRVASHQRQLIEGRDFRDILEACRPRHPKSMPSALRALLRSNQNDAATKGNAVIASSNTAELEEWGTLDLDAVTVEENVRRAGIARSASEEKRNAFQLSTGSQGVLGTPRDGDGDEAMEVSSQASSIASAMLSMSHDRSPYKTNPPSPSGSRELQRSLSLRMIMTDDDNVDGLFVPDTRSALSGCDAPDAKDHDGDLAGRLRDMMRSHDASMLLEPLEDQAPRSQLTANSAHHSVGSIKQQSGLGTKSRYSSGGKAAPSGGLGAALSQYGQHGSPAIPFVSVDGRGPVLNRTTSLMAASGSMGHSSYRRMHDTGSQALSPMLHPPVATMMHDFPDAGHDRAPPPHIPFESRFIKPQQYSRGRNFGKRTGSKAVVNSDAQGKEGIQSSRSLSVSPPSNRTFGSPPKEATQRRPAPRNNAALGKHSARLGSAPYFKSNIASRKKRAFNPFRQQDEEEVLAMKSHNRRRWSHVFPLGEVEFKRHAGPNWKSLTAPAILPLSIDYFPTQEEIDRKFTFSSYNVTLSEFEHQNYASNKDLFVEMVRQRLTQDFQVVSEDRINAQHYRRERNRSLVSVTGDGTTTATERQFLSMGHRLHVITYDPSADLIEVYRYDDKDTQKNFTFDYHYFALCQETQSYGRTRHTFSKYSAPYNWNKVDNIICGDEDREMREGMRFKRIMFGIIPDDFQGDVCAEEAYVAKFRRFLEYLEKLRDKVDSDTSPLDIKFVTFHDKMHQEQSKRMESTPGVERNSMIRIYIQLKKGKRDNLEWMELALDSTFDTTWSYRIMFNWLVASSGKVDAQVQLLQRRCSQYGLKLVPFPQITVSRNLYLHPFKAPAVLRLSNPMSPLELDEALSRLDYIHDGVFSTEVDALLECADPNGLFSFRPMHQSSWLSSRVASIKSVGTESAKKRYFPTLGKQVVHRTGTLFVRILTDLNGTFILVVLGNYRYLNVNKSEVASKAYVNAFESLTATVAALNRNVSKLSLPIVSRVIAAPVDAANVIVTREER